MHLTVIHPFGEYKRGDKITDMEKIKAIVEDEPAHENRKHVVRTQDAN